MSPDPQSLPGGKKIITQINASEYVLTCFDKCCEREKYGVNRKNKRGL